MTDNIDELRGKLAYSRKRLEAANEAKARAEQLSANARELGGGLLSFGGSGPQGAKRQAQYAQGRAFEAHRDADARIEKWTDKISSLERRIRESERVRLTSTDIASATHVRTRTGWHEVVKVNATTVTVKTPYSWTDRIALDKVLEHRTIGERAAS